VSEGFSCQESFSSSLLLPNLASFPELQKDEEGRHVVNEIELYVMHRAQWSNEWVVL
jgi:hypothetical protein